MSLFQMKFPVLVEYTDNRYRLNTLLFNGMNMSHQRYGDALRLLQNEVAKQYRNTILDQEVLKSILWYKFNPEYQFSVEHFVFRSGMHLVDGHFVTVEYILNKHNYVCFPKLDYLVVRIPAKIKKRKEKLAYLTDLLQRHFQAQKKDDEKFDTQAYYSSKNCSTITVEIQVEVKDKRFSFDRADDTFWAFMQQDMDFDGAEELETVGDDLSRRPLLEFDSCLYRESELEWLSRSMFSVKPQALVVIAPSGSGKSNIITATYHQYLESVKNQPAHRKQKMWLVDPLRVISGMSIVGQWERRFEAILTQLRDRLKKFTKSRLPDLLYIDNPVPLLKIGKTSQTELTLAHMLVPYIERREIPVILEATNEEWQKIQDQNRRFADLFRVLRLDHINRENIDHILMLRKMDFEKHFECEFTTSAFLSLIKMEPSLRGNKELPGSMVEMMRNIAVVSQNREIDDNRVYESMQKGLNVNASLLDGRKLLFKKDVLHYFMDNLAGQEQACQILSDTVLSIKAQMTQTGKPLNTMLFIGPTGVGKTEAAKLLTQYLYTKQESLVRIDMNEFGDTGAVSRLIGDIYHPHGILTERVRYQRSCVLLLDEIEKAHPNVHDILLQLLDDGRLTDAAGNTTDFSQTVVIMTSNVGAREASSHMGFVQHQGDLSATYKKSLETQFRPELINRIHNIVVFNALSQKHMTQLARLHLKKILRRDGFSRRNTILNVDEQCLQKLAEKSFDPLLGARALKRNLERFVTEATAHKLAEIKSETPIIINMRDELGSLICEAIELNYCEKNIYDPPSSIELALDGYQKIFDKLNSAEQVLIESSTAKQQGGFLYWMLVDNLRNVKEPLQSFIFEAEEKSKNRNLKSQYSFAPKAIKANHEFRKPRSSFGGIHAQQDIHDYLSGLYNRSESYFETTKINQLPLCGNANRILHTASTLLERGTDKLTIIIQSLVTHKGKGELDYLLNIYRFALDHMCSFEISEEINTNGVKITLEGTGIIELFDNETGIHLFYDEENIQIPILLKVIPEESKEYDCIPHNLLSDKTEILRIYSLKENVRHVADLRTGLLTKNYESDQWWSFVDVALPDYLEVNNALEVNNVS